VWTRLISSNQPDYGTGVAIDADGGLLVTGHTSGPVDGVTVPTSTEGFLVKYASNGIRQGAVLFGSSDTDQVRGIAAAADGSAYVTGYTWGSFAGYTNAGGYDPFLIRF
jgi:hypothetical protein